MRPNYIDNAKTFEERLARITRTKQASKKQHTLVRAANQMYRELQGKTKKQSTTRLVRVLRADIRGIYLACIRVPALPLPTCVVCGIALTSSRKRILCGSQFCKEERQRERSRCHYVGGRLSETPRMIAAAERYPLGRRTGKTNGKFRDPKPQQRPKKQKSSPERSQREYAVYVAMRELNLLPIKEDRS